MLKLFLSISFAVLTRKNCIFLTLPTDPNDPVGPPLARTCVILVMCAVSHAPVAPVRGHSTGTRLLPSTCTLIQLSLTLLEHWQLSTLGMKNDVGLAKESSEGIS